MQMRVASTRYRMRCAPCKCRAAACGLRCSQFAPEARGIVGNRMSMGMCGGQPEGRGVAQIDALAVRMGGAASPSAPHSSKERQDGSQTLGEPESAPRAQRRRCQARAHGCTGPTAPRASRRARARCSHQACCVRRVARRGSGLAQGPAGALLCVCRCWLIALRQAEIRVMRMRAECARHRPARALPCGRLRRFCRLPNQAQKACHPRRWP